MKISVSRFLVIDCRPSKCYFMRYFTMHIFIETRINNILIKRFTGEIMLEM